MKSNIELLRSRNPKKTTRRELSDLSGFPTSTIVVYENGKQKPSHKYLEFCSLYFGYTYECLYDYETEKALEPFKNKAFRVLEIYRIIHKINYHQLYSKLSLDNKPIFYSYNSPVLNKDKKEEQIKEELSSMNENELKNLIIKHLNVREDSFEHFGFEKEPNVKIDETKELITPDIYANFVKAQNLGNKAKILANKGGGLDVEILEALQGVNDDIKKVILTLLNLLKGGKMNNTT
ncbi:MAG: helix-turn-helix domain-containing protein [Campylobacter sp.]|uniref:helix-turn-helix transcriptional regulator n=1 Tax=Campylobacter sp. TaxID=205 RepID=UPI002A4AA267|nr:helix-turn-helix transcriptional regulator [Campylobacter sp.]MCI7548958.1 helix-turn-helix domain-containing protein [Campylobacter sp.]MDD6925336.1 helix-turn-helix transcriptional regulator [Campylobacteraceae bacterium]